MKPEIEKFSSLVSFSFPFYVEIPSNRSLYYEGSLLYETRNMRCSFINLHSHSLKIDSKKKDAVKTFLLVFSKIVFLYSKTFWVINLKRRCESIIVPISESINKCGLFQRATFWFFSYHIMSRFVFLRLSCIRLSNFSSTLLSFAELANALNTFY